MRQGNVLWTVVQREHCLHFPSLRNKTPAQAGVFCILASGVFPCRPMLRACLDIFLTFFNINSF